MPLVGSEEFSLAAKISLALAYADDVLVRGSLRAVRRLVKTACLPSRKRLRVRPFKNPFLSVTTDLDG